MLTIDTVLKCRAPIDVAPVDGLITVTCGTDVPVGSAIVYNYNAVDGCSYSVYDINGKCISEFSVDGTSTSETCGGGLTVTGAMSCVKFSQNTAVYKAIEMTVAELIAGITDITSMYSALDTYCIDEYLRQDIINIYLDTNSTGGSVAGLNSYPSGAIYLSVSNVSPESLFGGTWEALTGLFHESVFAWARTQTAGAICGTFLCGEALCGQ